MRLRSLAIAALCALVVFAGACSVQDGTGEGPPERAASTSSPTTTVPSDADPVSASVGLLTLDEVAYELTADCFAPGAGEVLVLAVGDGVEVYAQAFVGAPYMGVQIAGELLEPSIDRPFEFTLVDDILRVDDVALVTGLDLESGDGTPAGTGSVVIECRQYLDELPESFRG